jgi:hypothetical protein
MSRRDTTRTAVENHSRGQLFTDLVHRLLLLILSVVGAASFAATVRAVSPPWWKNCTQVNRHYPHGVGKVGAHDKTSGDPVTNFKRSNSLYALAIKHNRGLDRDHDGIACEKA